MARLASSLVLIALCLSIAAEAITLPPVAEAITLPPLAEGITLPPVAAPFPSPSQTQNALIKQMCHDTKSPQLCAKIVQGDQKTFNSLDDSSKGKMSIDLAKSIASRAGAYMSNQLKSDQVKAPLRSFVAKCNNRYAEAVSALDLAYINYELNPTKALASLRTADKKVGACAKNLNKGGEQGQTFPVADINVILNNLIDDAKLIVANRSF